MSKFAPGMLVVICESRRTGTPICLAIVSTVGKQQIRLVDSHMRYDLKGNTMSHGPYMWRVIKPVTKSVLAECIAEDAGALFLAEGREIPDDKEPRP